MSPAAARPRRSRLGFVVLLVLLGYGAWLAYQWWRTPSQHDVAFRPLPYVMYGFKPDHVRGGAGGLVRTTNALGFRGPPVAVPKPEGVYRIVCLGGSTTYGFAVGDDETYPVQLERVLRERRPDLDVEVVNAGVESYTTAESLANLAFRCLDLQPDCVVLYEGINDYRPRRYRNFDNAYIHYRKVWDGGLGPPLGRRDEINGINEYIQHPPPGDDWGDTRAHAAAAGTEAFRRNLVSIVGVARAHGIVPVLVTSATSPHDASLQQAAYNAELRAGIAEHNDVVRAVCAATGAPLVDIVPAMPGQADHWADLVHNTAKGSAARAALIAEGLLPHLP